jgi:phage-related protein
MMHISRFKYDNSTDRIKRYQMLLLHWSRNIMNIYTIKKNENEIEKNKKIKMNSKREFFYEIKVRFQDGIFNVFYFNLSSLHEFVLNLFMKIGVQAILLLFDVKLGKVI